MTTQHTHDVFADETDSTHLAGLVGVTDADIAAHTDPVALHIADLDLAETSNWDPTQENPMWLAPSLLWLEKAKLARAGLVLELGDGTVRLLAPIPQELLYGYVAGQVRKALGDPNPTFEVSDSVVSVLARGARDVLTTRLLHAAQAQQKVSNARRHLADARQRLRDADVVADLGLPLPADATADSIANATDAGYLRLMAAAKILYPRTASFTAAMHRAARKRDLDHAHEAFWARTPMSRTAVEDLWAHGNIDVAAHHADEVVEWCTDELGTAIKLSGLGNDQQVSNLGATFAATSSTITAHVKQRALEPVNTGPDAPADVLAGSLLRLVRERAPKADIVPLFPRLVPLWRLVVVTATNIDEDTATLSYLVECLNAWTGRDKA